MKTENWNGYNIRFVEKDGEWWAVGIDVAKALEYANPSKAILDHCKGVSKLGIPSPGGNQITNVISEIDIYNLIFKAADQSRSKNVKQKAEEFKLWVFNILKIPRQSTGLEGFQIFQMLDKEHQKEAMSELCHSLRKPVRVDFIKANVIANKAVSTKHGHPKMVKKADMTLEMPADRQELLDDTVNLMAVKEKFNLSISVSDEVYRMASGGNQQAS
ncbi:Bro-N domain-containing protein [uncultured Robinsoniella sp.]|uniref:BRO-N domain-containing protein n=1 Tax=uncultured Robinsoniella sp. TaxID=904190 RepID=UPI002910EFFA|nr:BRO family protein [Clostridiales bacterium]